MAPARLTRLLPTALATAAGGGALVALASEAPLFAVVLLLGCLAALVLRRSWIASEREYQRAIALHQAGLDEHRSVRTEGLLAKHGLDGALVARIERKELWVGETADQLRDALGEPEDIDLKPLRTRTREVWKYGRTGRNRYSTRITLDNGTVVRWQRRDPAGTRAQHETHP